MKEPRTFQPATFVRIIHENTFLKLEEWKHAVTGRPWYVLRVTDSIAGILHDVVNKRVLLIRSPHVAIQSEDNPAGECITPFAGRFDRNVSPKQLLITEAWQEVRVRLTKDEIVFLNNGESMLLSVGIIPEKTYLCYAQITKRHLSGKDTKVFGLKREGEEILREWVPEEIFLSDEYICHDLRVLAFRQYMQIMQLKEEIRRLKDASKKRWSNSGGI